MDTPRPALVNAARLRLSAEGRRLMYLIEDSANGRIFTVPRALALALHRLGALRRGHAGARALISEADGKEINGFLGVMQHMRQQESLAQKPFNPIFMGLPLFDVGPLQPGLRGLARAIVRPAYLWMLMTLALMALVLGMQSDWAIMAAFRNVFSLEALVTFGLIAPVLKIIHEFGHVLVATRFEVPVRKAGLYLIGLYPMPFVDLTEADVTAPRHARITISLAGIIVDVTIGLLAFVAWHFTAGSYAQTLLGNIFVFSTLNSLLFNGNPLIKLDGYFVLTDLIGQRNLYSRASSVMSDARKSLMSLGRSGTNPRGAGQWGMLSYGVLAFLYRLNIIFVIASALLPRHLGLGAVIVAWGGFAMFASPLLRDPAPQAPDLPGAALRRWIMRGGFLAGLAAALIFIEAPYRVTVPIALNFNDHYRVTAPAGGFLTQTLQTGMTGQITLENPVIAEELLLLDADLSGAEAALAAVQSADPAQAQVAAEQVASFRERRTILERERDGLRVSLAADALFVPVETARLGRYVPPGETLGVALPRSGTANMAGAFPERYVQLFQDGVTDAELRRAGLFSMVPVEALELVAIPSLDPSSGTRGYALHLTLDHPPAEISGQPTDLRLRFGRAPLWQHAVFFAEGLLARYRDNILVDRADYLGEA